MQFLTGDLQGSHDPGGVVFTVLAAMSGMEREYIRDRTLEGHESARMRGKGIGGASVTDDDMLGMALHLRDQELSLREIAARLVITKGAKKGQHPSPPTVMRMLREHDERVATTTMGPTVVLEAAESATGTNGAPESSTDGLGSRGPHNSHRSRVLRGPLEPKRPWGPSRVPGRSPVHRPRGTTEQPLALKALSRRLAQ
ncbi:hypothetical protein ACWGDS_46715 [Streptomyces sp. NPDC055059]